jgi:hypothetical protein
MTPEEREEWYAKERARRKKRYEIIREKSLESARKWREANPGNVKEMNRKWYERNREKSLERARKWREVNPEKHRDLMRKWAKSNPEKSNKWRQVNPEKYRDLMRKWRKANLEKARAAVRKSKRKTALESAAADALRMMAAGAELTKALKKLTQPNDEQP